MRIEELVEDSWLKTIPRQLKVQQSLREDVRAYLEEVNFSISDFIEFAVDSYMLVEDRPTRYNPTYLGIYPFELKDESLSFRLSRDKYEEIQDYMKRQGMKFSEVIYQAILEWLYVGKRIKKQVGFVDRTKTHS